MNHPSYNRHSDSVNGAVSAARQELWQLKRSAKAHSAEARSLSAKAKKTWHELNAAELSRVAGAAERQAAAAELRIAELARFIQENA